MSRLALLLAIAAVSIAGCGEKEETLGTQPADPPAAEKEPTKKPAAKEGTEVIVAGSEFGDMLYGADKQAIYIFENDGEGKSACYGECAELWPPVYSEGKPQAGDGVKAGLLGTTRRRDGREQVTYNGKPLYFYAHEEPGEVRCHNVFLNGGLWWAIGPDGERLD